MQEIQTHNFPLQHQSRQSHHILRRTRSAVSSRIGMKKRYTGFCDSYSMAFLFSLSSNSSQERKFHSKSPNSIHCPWIKASSRSLLLCIVSETRQPASGPVRPTLGLTLTFLSMFPILRLPLDIKDEFPLVPVGETLKLK